MLLGLILMAAIGIGGLVVANYYSKQSGGGASIIDFSHLSR